MRRLLAILAGSLGFVSMPLALSSITSWLLVPCHAVLTAVACAGAVAEAGGGRPERARLWGLAYLVATALMLGALEVGAARGGGYWSLPLAAVLMWGWVPPLVAGLAGWWGGARRRRLATRAVRQRKRERAQKSVT